jgi:hypothetical protein
MSTNVSNNIIELTRGDSARYPLFINQGSDIDPSRYDLKDKDELYLGIMEPNQPFECALVKKKYTKASIKLDQEDNILIKIEPEDTVALIPGKYYYQIKLRKYTEYGDYDVITIIDKTEFWVQE